jgi:hypothetical protein
MARNSKKTPIVIADSIIDPAIDHHTQTSSWAMSESAVSLEDEFGPILIEPDADLALLEVIEAQAAVNDEQVSEAPASDDLASGADFKLAIESFSDEDVLAKAHAISDAIDVRGDFETQRDPNNVNIHKTLKKVRSAFVSKAAARVMLATNVSETFINRSVHEGACYNVYALGKIADLMKAATDGAMTTAINIACMRSLFAMQAAGKAFNLETAKACASKQYPCDAAIRQHLVRHTVAPGTAPTQASSTMQAMVTLGIVSTSGSAKNPTYALTKSPIVARMREVLAA